MYTADTYFSCYLKIVIAVASAVLGALGANTMNM
ncbi:smalltalk protein [Bacteroides intestinalis]